MRLTKFWAHFISFIFPAYCLACGTQISSPGWCRACVQKLPRLETRCPSCGRPVYPQSHLCGECQASLPPFAGVWVSLSYQGLWAEALKRFKYHGALWLVKPLVEVWRETLDTPLPDIDVVVPVPLHVKRLRERGFNQSLLLARVLFAGPKVKNWLIRHRETPPQVGLDLASRKNNVKGAFSLASKAEPQGLRILLVDDVMTTGATARECAQVLKKAGAIEVYVAVLARAGYNV